MKTPTRFAVSLALSAILALPAIALAKDHGRGGDSGDRGQSHWRSRGEGSGRSFENRGYRGGGEQRQRSEMRSYPRDRGSWSGGNRGSWGGNRSQTRDRGSWNGGRGGRPYGPSDGFVRDRVGSRDNGSGYRTYTRNHQYRGGTGSETRYRGDRNSYQRYNGGGYRSYDGRYYGGYRGGYRSYGGYYTRGFYRPHYHYSSYFSLGLSIGYTPIDGYRYYDPYCGIYFRSLGAYYDHCLDYDHPEAILVMDRSLRAPVATCIYDSGNWVVDDSGDNGYDDDGYDY